MQSIISPVISTSLYFVVFGAAIGSRIKEIDGISYGAFTVPGLIMMMLLTQSTANASFGIYFPKCTGTILELLSAPISYIGAVPGRTGNRSRDAREAGISRLAPDIALWNNGDSVPLALVFAQEHGAGFEASRAIGS
jgi:ABC-2 type transport system permease protein